MVAGCDDDDDNDDDDDDDDDISNKNNNNNDCTGDCRMSALSACQLRFAQVSVGVVSSLFLSAAFTLPQIAHFSIGIYHS